MLKSIGEQKSEKLPGQDAEKNGLRGRRIISGIPFSPIMNRNSISQEKDWTPGPPKVHEFSPKV